MLAIHVCTGMLKLEILLQHCAFGLVRYQAKVAWYHGWKLSQRHKGVSVETQSRTAATDSAAFSFNSTTIHYTFRCDGQAINM